MKLIEDDCLKALAAMPENSVDSVVCDPPYNLSFMGRNWDTHDTPLAFQEWCQSWAELCLRVLKPGGYLLAFGGPRTFHRQAVGIEDAGFGVRDTLAWVRAQGFPHSRNLPGGLGTNLKPSVEPVTMARKPLSESSVADNYAEHGTGVLNIDACRIAATDKAKFPVGDYGDRGIYGANGQRTEDPDTEGRWPPNLALDEVAAEILDEQSGELRPGTAVNRNRTGDKPGGTFGTFAAATKDVGYGDAGGASKFFFCPKATTAERKAGLAGKNTHPTVKPIDLMRWLVRLVTPPGGVVCDPFAGSGSTGIAAGLESLEFIGIEREAEYAEIARTRLAWWANRQGDTADILKRAGLAVKLHDKHAKLGQLQLPQGVKNE